MKEMKNVLICDDNVAIHASLSAYLKAEHFKPISVYDGETAIKAVKEKEIALIILDIMLPGMSGTEVCREIRKFSDVPILMLSARGEELDRILGLELGADDYVTKPFSPREVATRVRIILRRARAAEKKKNIQSYGELAIDMESYEASVNGEILSLTPRELETLNFLAENAGKVLSREQILNQVWGYDYYGDTRTVDTQVKRLRRKLPEEGMHFSIKAIYGVGYKFEVEP